ncbi:MAG: hypothetical protein KC656_06795 [Myxococcales bacterium]|nr:hypothetical protein [Myxococcales bacterium]
MLTLLHAALAAPPTNGAGVIDIGSGTIDRLAWSSDREVVVGRDRASGTGFVVEIDSWRVHTLDPCGVTSVTTVPFQSILEIYAGCDDGRIFLYELDDEVLTQPEDLDGNPIYWQLQDSSGQDVQDPIPGLFWNLESTNAVLLAYQQGSATSYVHAIDLNTGNMDADVYSNWPALASGTGWVDGEIDQSSLYMVHADRYTTIVGLTTGIVSFAPLVSGGLLYGIDDITPGNGRLWVTDTDLDAVFSYQPLQGTFGTPFLGMVSAPQTLARSSTTGDEWMIVAGDTTAVYGMTGATFTNVATPSWTDPAPLYQVVDLLAGPDYTFGGTTTGELQVFSARPWVDEVSIAPGTGEPGTPITLSFRVSEPADWSVWLNGDRTGTGASLGVGTTTTDDQVVTVQLQANDNWLEGENLIYVVAAGDNLIKGHARASFTIDTPPEPPVLAESALGFASGGLTLSFDGIEDADLDHYLVYVSETAFAPEDYATGGPTPPEGLDAPITVDAEPGARTTLTISPLTNGVTYYVAVRSVDSGGQESSMSNVVSGVPEDAYGASHFAGETGGGPCATGPSGGPLALGLALLGVVARRSRGAALLGLLGSASALAADDGERRSTGDMTKQSGDFEIRYGPFLKLDDTAITDVYGKTGHEMLQVEFGPQITRLFEIDFEVGFYQELAYAQSTGGTASSQRTMLTWYPLGLSGSARLHLVDEQMFVPFARLGMDYVYFAELTDNASGGKDKVSGSKLGNHYALGASLLLDIFAPARASLLEAQTGINDTYLTVEWRRQNIDARKAPWASAVDDGFDLSGSMLTMGLKLDY